MCTVTWEHTSEGYQLYCNRDETLTRKRALPPTLQIRDDVRFVAPVDGDFGGTWIAVNEFGLSICLLNGPGRRGTLSRGSLVTMLMSAASIEEVCERIALSDLAPYALFQLAVLAPGSPTAVIEWNGVRKRLRPDGESLLPLTSSSFDAETVRDVRLLEYRQAPNLRAFHSSHGMWPSAYSPCMHRSDAETVSFSCVTVTESAADFHYLPAAPCQRVPAERRRLSLARRNAGLQACSFHAVLGRT
jgi:hypothetical protein